MPDVYHTLPQGIDIARVMDFLVSDMLAQGIKPQVPDVALFNKVFLRDVDILGRSLRARAAGRDESAHRQAPQGYRPGP